MANPGPATTVANHPSNLSTNQALRLLASFQGVNVNAGGDTVLPIINTDRYSVSNVVFTNASVSLTTALAGVFTAPNAGGTAIVANAALSAMTSASVVSQRTVASTAASASAVGVASTGVSSSTRETNTALTRGSSSALMTNDSSKGNLESKTLFSGFVALECIIK
jgi:hypothetical protein